MLHSSAGSVASHAGVPLYNIRELNLASVAQRSSNDHIVVVLPKPDAAAVGSGLRHRAIDILQILALVAMIILMTTSMHVFLYIAFALQCVTAVLSFHTHIIMARWISRMHHILSATLPNGEAPGRHLDFISLQTMCTFVAEHLLRLQQKNTSNQRKSELAAFFSHELRLPFSVMEHTLDLLQREMSSSDPVDCSTHVQRMVDESKGISRTLNQMLLVQMIEDGRSIQDVENVDVIGMVTDLLNAYRLAGEEKSIHIAERLANLNEIATAHCSTMNPALGIPYSAKSAPASSLTSAVNDSAHPYHYVNQAFIRCDGWQIKQIISHLLGNSVKHCRAKSNIHVQLDFQNFVVCTAVVMSTKQKAYKQIGEVDVVVQIADNGPGISAARQQTLFQHIDKKSGWGLYVCDQLIKANSGKIVCSSSNANGTTMTVIFRAPVDLVRVKRRDRSLPSALISSTLVSQSRVDNASSASASLSSAHTVKLSPLPPRHIDHSALYLDRVYVNLADSAKNWPIVNASQPQSSAALDAPMEKLPGSTVSPVVIPSRRLMAPISIAAASVSSLSSSPSSAASAIGTTKAQGEVIISAISPSATQFRVMFVDDCPHTRKLWYETLTRKGYFVQLASNGWECITLFGLNAKGTFTRKAVCSPQNIGAIIMDGSMPLMDGFQACKTLALANINVPTVALTGNIAPEQVKILLDVGVQQVFDKAGPREAVFAWLREVGSSVSTHA
jgi:signal transduction histidine kinase